VALTSETPTGWPPGSGLASQAFQRELTSSSAWPTRAASSILLTRPSDDLCYYGLRKARGNAEGVRRAAGRGILKDDDRRFENDLAAVKDWAI
jgi:hypothetical protein